ncbi:hypothetical protein [Streptomyces sp. NBC_00503]|uniref:hypothetical protein n=1 Tax=Streptomyces sp. NBC_00503 TaxID=2903659 RepID=UPI002E80B690|nr:hypothetical protein [Streptomyces sp. NBC_00503]WUD79846.1 hypothetical protein OG490_04260 [Streptomyces sp. NBC_00503]
MLSARCGPGRGGDPASLPGHGADPRGPTSKRQAVLCPVQRHPESPGHGRNSDQQTSESPELVCCFALGEECWRGGHRPDFLLPELVEAKILAPDGSCARPEDEPCADRDRLTLSVLEHRFALSLPRRLVEEAALPAFVTCTH